MPYICLVLSQFAAQMVQQGKQARGVGRMGAAEAAELEQRGRQLPTAVSGYGPRIKPWLPGGLQPVYQGWVAAAAALGGPAPSRAQGACNGHCRCCGLTSGMELCSPCHAAVACRRQAAAAPSLTVPASRHLSCCSGGGWKLPYLLLLRLPRAPPAPPAAGRPTAGKPGLACRWWRVMIHAPLRA